jgi:hypothetical protein
MGVKLKRILSKILLVTFLVSTILMPNRVVLAKNNKNTNFSKQDKSLEILVKFKNSSESTLITKRIKDKLKLSKIVEKKALSNLNLNHLK